ncbi:zona pellucida sperm-binding 3-like isoform X1 [Labeo rohita]|uniref:Zona pellucida sperm-binding protein 3 n=1 Tax=Labeo rohita TaxID=84645 RepID=A0A498MBJ8_LABRO|nr:zona pellucida sperm-binding 3-like isoform X1 [Labeo rohita]
MLGSLLREPWKSTQVSYGVQLPRPQLSPLSPSLAASSTQSKEELLGPVRELTWKFPEVPAEPEQPDINFELAQPRPSDSVAVQCWENGVHVEVKQDFFGTGQLLEPSQLSLGGCGVMDMDAAARVLIFHSALQECGSELVATEDELVYIFTIDYRPAALQSTPIVRSSGATIAVECHYPRRQNVSSNDLQPAWIPYVSTKVVEDALVFSLKVMTDEWMFERPSNVFFLGDVLNIQASVKQYNHVPLRIFVDNCVATAGPDVSSAPMYSFIENHGCLTDAKYTGSVSSFLPRVQDDKLQFQLEAFRFQQESSGAIYITCLVKATAASTSQIDEDHKSCSFRGNGWVSLDGNDQVCGCCDTSCGLRTDSVFPKVPGFQWEGKAQVGPLQDSEVMYSGRLSLVGDLLQGLFKEAYSLQKGLMELLDKINLEDTASEEEVSDIVTVIHSLLDICSIISRLDIALHANTWKFIVKQSVKYQSLVEDRLHHTDIAFSLCEDLYTSVQNCLELAQQIQQAGLQEVVHCPEYKLFQKATKMCRFFANTLVHYTKEFKAFLAKSCHRFHQLYLQIHSRFSPSVCAPSVPPALSEELRVAVLVPMDAMLTQLLSFRPFAESVLDPNHQCSTELCLPQCLLLVSVLGKLSSQPEEALQLWSDGSQFSEESPRWSVFEAVLQSFRRCMLERAVPVWLPGVMLRGQAQGREQSLLAAVLQADTQTAVLATDVWCFLARYGTAELCFHHVQLIAHLIRSCPGEGYQLFHLALLLRRLLFLMTPKHQVEFVERFLPAQEENLCVWRHALLRCLCAEARMRVEEENRILGCVLMLMGGSNLQAECEVSSVKIISQLWSRMSSNQITNHEEVISQTLTSEEIKTKVLNFLSKTVSNQESEEARLERLKEWRRIIEKHCEQLECENNTPVHTPLTEEPCPKRARQETKVEEEYERYLQTAESALKALQTIVGPDHSPSPPQWVRIRLQVLQTLITQINTTTVEQP